MRSAADLTASGSKAARCFAFPSFSGRILKRGPRSSPDKNIVPAVGGQRTKCINLGYICRNVQDIGVIEVLISLMIGFAAGYGVRDGISRRRRQEISRRFDRIGE